MKGRFAGGGGGVEQRSALDKIKKYLMTPPVLRVRQAGKGFRLYIAAQERVIGAVLVQEENDKEIIVAFVSRRLLDSEMRYVFIEKLCLSLYYACSKFRHYILASH
jgi:hypothetical protein